VTDPDIVAGGYADEAFDVAGGSVHLLSGGSGPPLLYLHGGGAAGVWRRFHALLAERFDVLAPDHPGFGSSDALPGIANVRDLADLYLSLADRLNLDRVLLVGASFGGWIAWELALRAPQLVDRLVLLASIGLDLPEHPVTPLFPRPREEALAMLFHDDELARAYSAGAEFGSVLGSERDAEALGRYLSASTPSAGARLAKLAVPTLLVWGDDDRVVPHAHGERLAAALPQARLETIPDCGHGLPFEAPEAVARAITAFARAPRPAR
jgi:pimeloyl-ACP methyl ester carboxylesterase